ncbi:MAG: beta-lactamase family protein [Planctomycetes bacterium]|nr:beta-lactamase family protein [Planctomycetota bacterium]
MRRRILVCSLALAGAALALSGGQDDLRARDAVIARLERVLADARANLGAAQAGGGSLSGLALTIQTGGRTWWSRGDGWLDPHTRLAARPEAAVPAAAAWPALAALSVAKLVERAKLGFDDPLAQHLPEFAGERQSPTVRQVLAHVSGLAPCDGWFDARARAGEPPSRDELLAWIAAEPADFAPGTCARFSSADLVVATALVERVSERNFARFAREELLAAFDGAHAARSAQAADHEAEHLREVGGALEVGGELVSLGRVGECFALEDLALSADDLARLARAAARGAVVSSATWRELSTPYRLVSGASAEPGERGTLALGFDFARLCDTATVGFGGRAAGISLHASYYPEFDVALALVAAGDRASLDLVERRLARVFLDLAEPEVLDLPLAPEERVPYLGGFYIGCNRAVVGEQAERLTLGLPERDPVPLFFQGGHSFVVDGDSEVRVTFELVDARAVRFVLEERGMRTVAVRID